MDEQTLDKLLCNDFDEIVYDDDNITTNHNSTSIAEEALDEAESNLHTSLKLENEILRKKLNEEQQRASKYQKKVMYIQEHAELLGRLRQAYLSMKYKEPISRDEIEVKEVCSQTPTVTFRREDIDAVKQSLNALTEHVNNRPFSHLMKDEREVKYKMDIITLFKEKLELKKLVQEKLVQVDELENQLIEKQLPIDCNALKIIIAKLNINLRHAGGNCIIKLTDMENKIVNHITEKYEIKVESRKSL